MNAPFRPLTAVAHELLAEVLRPGDWAIDATAGNGHDTQFLAQCVGEAGRVLAMDVQLAAIESTARRLDDSQPGALTDVSGRGRFAAVRQIGPVTLAWGSHTELARLAARLAEEEGTSQRRFRAIAFNLGFRPGGHHGVTTTHRGTTRALAAALDWLEIGGRLTVLVYPGHPAGVAELAVVRELCPRVPTAEFAVQHFRSSNDREHAPQLFAVTRVAASPAPPSRRSSAECLPAR